MEYFINNYYAYTHLVPTDIYPVQYGEEQCNPNHAFGPCIRSNYLIHYIYQGNGTFKTESNEYHLHKNQMFLIKPNQLTYYKADAKNPWMYRWIEFNGSMAAQLLKSSGFSKENPILNDNQQLSVGTMLSDIVQCGDMPFETLMQKFWGFLSTLSNTENSVPSTATHEYINKAESFIKINIHKKITVSDVAMYIGIDRSHLSRLFSTYKGVSPQQYILSLKMRTAAHYLKNTSISISEVAQSVGYTDSRVFNKAFKTQFHTSPSAWRQKKPWENSIL